ncbi:hypothetical protein [Rathayibacter rathayi]|uniref:hypothetical protein n=1 Tax=Rathayibacter rathayi TaxID=33887 RepID=UPI0015E1FCF0|nr:hypothetical protein [Rathayibacter rathayi]
MQKHRGWSIALGVLLIAISIFTFIQPDGRIEAYVSAGGCLLSGIIITTVALRRPTE